MATKKAVAKKAPARKPAAPVAPATTPNANNIGKQVGAGCLGCLSILGVLALVLFVLFYLLPFLGGLIRTTSAPAPAVAAPVMLNNNQQTAMPAGNTILQVSWWTQENGTFVRLAFTEKCPPVVQAPSASHAWSWRYQTTAYSGPTTEVYHIVDEPMKDDITIWWDQFGQNIPSCNYRP